MIANAYCCTQQWQQNVCNQFFTNCNFLTMYLYMYINAHVQHLIYWQGQPVCDALFVVRQSILCATLDWMWNHVIKVFLFPLDQSFLFSIIIVTWKFCFPSVNSTIFLFKKCCHIFDITEFRKKKHPALDHSLHIHHIFLCFLGVWVYACIIMVELHFFAFTFWQRKCPWHAVCVLHYWYKFQQLDYSSIIINLLCRVVTKIVSECWNIIFVHPHWSFFHHLHTTSVIVCHTWLCEY